MSFVNVDVNNITDLFYGVELEKAKDNILKSYHKLNDKVGLGKEMLGWLSLPNTKESLIMDIKETAEKIRKESQVLLVIGIGGSYLGAKACIEMFKNPFKKEDFEVIFVGNTMSSTYISQLKDYLKDKDFSINVISKSGTTLEPAISFRIFNELLVKKYGDKAHERVYATTDKSLGALRSMCYTNEYKSFVIPSDVGGRYSVLTPVGLLPICCANIDIVEILTGAKEAMKDLENNDIESNIAMKYALARYLLHRIGKDVEVLVNYEPCMLYFAEWWKQLFGESEGKEQKGLLPVSVTYTTDLHSLGQYMQDGRRSMFETVISIKDTGYKVNVPFNKENTDNLNYLTDKDLQYINKQALIATKKAHEDGDCPNALIEVENLSPYTFGYLVYFFEVACAISGYALGVNPFDQPGVEAYKTNLKKLLNK